MSEPATTDAPQSPAVPAFSPHHLRLFALLIDYLLIVVVLNLGQQALLGRHWDLQPPSESLWSAAWPRLAAGIALFLLRDAAFGLSPGKWLMGIAVRRADQPARVPGRGALVARHLTLPLLPLEAMWIFVDPYTRRLGDKLAGTVVVALPEPAPIGRRLLAFTAFLLAALLAGLLVAPWNMRRSAAFEEARRILAESPEIAAQTGPGVEVTDPEQFDLDLQAHPPTAKIRFSLQGSLGTVDGELVLRMEDAPRRWMRDSLSMGTPALAPSDAPPPPADD